MSAKLLPPITGIPGRTMAVPATLKVLFVDDDHGDVELARHALERDGLEIEWLRVDTQRSLIHGLVAGARNVDIVMSVIELGHRLGFTVLAEGVETEDELELLAQLGCSQAQGFLLSKPSRPSSCLS